MTSKPILTQKIDDFNLNELVRLQDHERLSSRVDTIEEKLGPGFAKFFCDAAEDSTKIQGLIAKKIVLMALTDPETRGAIAQIVEKTDGRIFKSFLKKGGWLVWTLVTAAVSSIATLAVQRWILKG